MRVLGFYPECTKPFFFIGCAPTTRLLTAVPSFPTKIITFIAIAFVHYKYSVFILIVYVIYTKCTLISILFIYDYNKTISFFYDENLNVFQFVFFFFFRHAISTKKIFFFFDKVCPLSISIINTATQIITVNPQRYNYNTTAIVITLIFINPEETQ